MTKTSALLSLVSDARRFRGVFSVAWDTNWEQFSPQWAGDGPTEAQGAAESITTEGFKE